VPTLLELLVVVLLGVSMLFVATVRFQKAD